MKKLYLLLCCVDGEHDDPEVYTSLKEARERMKCDYTKVFGWNEEELTDMNHESDDDDAWIEVADHTYYWAVREIEI